MALTRIWIPSPNKSSRQGSQVRLIVLHTAEGARTYQELGTFFGKTSSGVSSHVGIDDTLGTIGEYVSRPNKAWTQANANPYAVSAELCAFASWSKTTWQIHQTMLQNTSRWIAEEAVHFGIPITRLTASQAQDGKSKGVCQHVDLGALGGGHWDCGPNFPMDNVLYMAKHGALPPTLPPSVNEGDDLFIRSNDKVVYQLIYGGEKTYWRPIANGMVQNIPPSQIIDDPNGSWKAYWKVGSG